MRGEAARSLRRRFALVLIWLQLFAAGCEAQTNERAAAPNAQCRNAAKASDPWLEEIAQRLLTHDTLLRQLVKTQGPPVSCSGGPNQEFDGRQFGSIRFAWREGLAFAVQTLPPESSIVELAQPGGFPDPSALVQLVQTYVRDRGMPIDWSKPQLRPIAGGRVEEFRSDKPGMNAGVAFQYEGDSRLVAVRISLAL
jgi:hypothetical protein